MVTITDLAEIEHLYRTRGERHYGEGVSQIEHGLQCAALASAAGATPGLIVAALLHDIGHLLVDDDAADIVDRRHEATGAAALSRLFGPDVCAPIALHVAAKRYLCATDPGYRDGLSAASRASLVMQGGAFDAAGAARFERGAHWRQAVMLRRLDDRGKATEPTGHRLDDYLPLMRALARPRDGHRPDRLSSGD